MLSGVIRLYPIRINMAHPYFMIKISQSFDCDGPYNVIIDG
jgi:hypothetical protein